MILYYYDVNLYKWVKLDYTIKEIERDTSEKSQEIHSTNQHLLSNTRKRKTISTYDNNNIIDNLSKQIYDKDKTIEELQNEILKINKEKLDSIHRKKILEQENDSLEHENKRIKLDVNTSKERSERFYRLLEGRYDKLLNDNQNLHEDLNKLRDENNKLIKKNNELTREINNQKRKFKDICSIANQ